MTPSEFNLAEELKQNRLRVAIFGSARLDPESEPYKNAYELAKNIAGLGMDVVTGGGPGIMQAASEGHKAGDPEDKVKTIGINIRLPEEQAPNSGLEIIATHDRFSTRLDEFMLLSNIIVIMPGGVGTCLEFFYTWQLVQVHHVCRMPIILVGDMWRNLIDWVIDNPLEHNYLDSKDLESIVLVDNVTEAFEVIKQVKDYFETTGEHACMNWKMYGKKF